MFKIKEIDVTELKKRFDKNFSFTLLDVREPYEVQFANIEPHVHIPMGTLPVRHEEIDKEKPIIVICHTGVRSAQVCQYLETLGYDVTNLEGGIDAWSMQVDPSVPRYYPPPRSMFETSCPSKNHGNVVFITSGDHFLIANGASWLDYHLDTRILDGVNAIPKWKECVRG